MKILKLKKGLYSFVGSKLADKIIVEFDEETRMWYAYDIESGQPVVDCQQFLGDIVDKLE